MQPVAGRETSAGQICAATIALSTVVIAIGGCASHPPAHHSHHSTASTPSSASAGQAKRPKPAATPSITYYWVQPGDTLYAIAFRNQLDYHDLANWNDIGRDYAIHVGQKLRLSPLGNDALPSVAGNGPAAASSVSPATAAADRPATGPSSPAQAPYAATALALPASTWRWPLDGPIVRTFAPDEGSKGVDISGAIGQVVKAAAAGKVVYSGAALKGYGELIIVKHNEDYLSAYGYNSRRLVEEGAMVTSGQPIAEVGAAPGQKPALHFEIRIKGVPVDPMKFLPASP